MCNKLKVKLAVYISTYKTVFTAVLKTIISNIFNCFQLIMPLFGFQMAETNLRKFNTCTSAVSVAAHDCYSTSDFVLNHAADRVRVRLTLMLTLTITLGLNSCELLKTE